MVAIAACRSIGIFETRSAAPGHAAVSRVCDAVDRDPLAASSSAAWKRASTIRARSPLLRPLSAFASKYAYIVSLGGSPCIVRNAMCRESSS